MDGVRKHLFIFTFRIINNKKFIFLAFLKELNS